jgi:hypothetical protein
MYITANALRAAAHCTASKDIRQYLNGVYVNFKTEDRATVAATDGHFLFVGLADTQDMGELLGTALIIPNDALKKLDKRAQTVELSKIGENAYRLGDIVFTPVDGTFPSIGPVIPDASTIASREIKPAIYNPDLLVRARKALQTYYGTKPTAVFQFAQYGNDCGIMHAGEHVAQVVIMPMHAKGVQGAEAVHAFNRDYL